MKHNDFKMSLQTTCELPLHQTPQSFQQIQQKISTHPNYLKCVYAIFHKQVPLKTILSIKIDQTVDFNFRSHTWIICGSLYESRKWNLIFSKYLQYSKCYGLSLNQIQYPFFTKDISHVYWMNMKDLTIKNCNLTNVEDLLFVQAKNIQNIDLSENRIHSFGILFRKSHFIKLKQLKINSNQFNKLSDVTRLDIQQKDEKGKNKKHRLKICYLNKDNMDKNKQCIQQISHLYAKSKFIPDRIGIFFESQLRLFYTAKFKNSKVIYNQTIVQASLLNKLKRRTSYH